MSRSTRERHSIRGGAALRGIVERAQSGDRIDLSPSSAYEAVTRQMVEDLVEEIRQVRGRVDSLSSLIVGAIVLQVVLRLAGWN